MDVAGPGQELKSGSKMAEGLGKGSAIGGGVGAALAAREHKSSPESGRHFISPTAALAGPSKRGVVEVQPPLALSRHRYCHHRAECGVCVFHDATAAGRRSFRTLRESPRTRESAYRYEPAEAMRG
jgi:hypothetical protein